MLRYLRETARLGLVFQRLKTGKAKVLQGYIDADYTEDLDQSPTGYVFTVAGCIISCKAELQDTITLSTIEAEYMAAVEASKEVLWLRRLASYMIQFGFIAIVRV